jgi:NAD(P) transhydrogenase subunit alpha
MLEVLILSIAVFVLAMFVGFEVINRVPQMLHTPLMSGANAISGITIVGALIVSGLAESAPIVTAFGVIAVILATVNVVAGFLVTDRMLQMFHKDPEAGQ